MKDFKFKINNNNYNVEINEVIENTIKLQVNGQTYEVELEKDESTTQQTVSKPKVTPTFTTKSKPNASSGSSKAVKSPLPGLIVSVKVKEGDAITKGTIIIVMEAMKMENNIQSEFDGKVASVRVKEGQSVLQGDVLVEID